MYITSAYYEQKTGQKAPDNFEMLLEMASAELDSVTRFYYHFNELTDDFKGKQFKRALIAQITFYTTQNVSSVEQLNAKPDSVRIGETTVSYNRTGTGAEASKRETGLSLDALNVLRGTGLLYRGVGHV